MRILKFICFTLFLSCASKSSIVSNQAVKSLKEAVENKTIRFTGRSASPLNFGNNLSAYNLLPPGSNQAFINLANINNHLTIDKDSITMDLPFYGEQRMINAYKNNDNSFIFNQKLNEKTVVFNPKKSTYTIKMWVKGRQESLRINYTLHPNNSAQMVVNSTHRNSITYRGVWAVVDP